MGEGAGEDPAVRRKRLRFRSWHRGTREMDLMLGTFADRALDSLSRDEFDRYEALLAVSDADLYAWIAGRAPVPPQYARLVTLLRNVKIAAK